MTTDTERPVVFDRDALGREMKCNNPGCDRPVRVAGEPCTRCWLEQERARLAYRQQRERRTA